MSSKTLKVSIVIPNYNGETLLKSHLPSVLKAYKNKKNNIKEVIVVDDASNDGSVKLIKQVFPEVRLIVHKKNRRFSAAVNTGFRSAENEIICLLNSDVSPVVDFLENVFKHFTDKSVFGVSLSEKGYSWALGSYKNGFVEHSPGKISKTSHHTFWVSGGSGVFRRDMWMELKGLDEELYTPFYWEDLDIGYRALKRGYKLVWEPSAKVSHDHESTNKIFSDKYRSRIQQRNQLFFIWKNITSSNLTKKHMTGLLKRLVKHPGYFVVTLMALKKLPTVLRKRKIEKKESVVSDESIFQSFQK